MYNPDEDGNSHVNVYSHARTLGGRWASNFALSPFTHPRHGDFHSVEGLWYWLSTRDDRLRVLHGFAAKKLGRELRGADWVQDDAFKMDVRDGIRAKILVAKAANTDALRNLRATRNLPLAHYYVFGAQVHDETARYRWMLDEFDLARHDL